MRSSQRDPIAQTRPTYCRICEAACGLLADLDERGQVLRLRPDRQHPVSRGYVCAKGTRFLEVADHPERLLYPLRRQTDGSYKPISWPEALTVVSERLRPILDRYGPHAVGIYFGNPLAFNALGVLAMLGLMRALGSRNVFTAGSQDCNNKFTGAQLLHGSPLIHPIPDFEHADLALLLGTNPAVSQSSFVHLEGGSAVFDRLVDRGGRVVVVDPRRTESAERWGEHLPIRPGTDIFLLLALLHDRRDDVRPDARIEGLDVLLELAAAYPLERAAALTGLDPEHLAALSRDLRTANRAAFHMSVGINQGPFGTLSYVALQALAYLSGQLDRRGGLLFHPLAVLAGELARRFRVGTGQVRSRVGGLPMVLDSLPGGILADEILTPGPEQIRALIVVGGNPLTSIPGEAHLRRALRHLDFQIHVDLFNNDTGREADLLLPATSWLERWDVASTTVFFQQAPFIQYAGPVRAAPGETRSEARILADLSLAIGRPFLGNSFMTRLWRVLARDAGLARLTDLLTWPVRLFLNGAAVMPSLRPRPGRYLGRGPRTPGHRVRFWHHDLAGEPQRLAAFAASLEAQPPARLVSSGSETPSPALPLTLICRRRRLGHNSWLHGAVSDGKTEAAAWFSPVDFERLGLVEGGEVRLESSESCLTLPAACRIEVAAGTVVVPHGLPEANVNALIPTGLDRLEPLSGQHWLTGIPVTVQACEQTQIT